LNGERWFAFWRADAIVRGALVQRAKQEFSNMKDTDMTK
jgi:hypothetical protein